MAYFSLINVGSGSHCLRSIFFFSFGPPFLLPATGGKKRTQTVKTLSARIRKGCCLVYDMVTWLYMFLGGTWAEACKKYATKSKKALERIKKEGLGTQLQKGQHQTHRVGSESSSNKLNYPYTDVGRQAGAVCKGSQDVIANWQSSKLCSSC